MWISRPRVWLVVWAARSRIALDQLLRANQRPLHPLHLRADSCKPLVIVAAMMMLSHRPTLRHCCAARLPARLRHFAAPPPPRPPPLSTLPRSPPPLRYHFSASAPHSLLPTLPLRHLAAHLRKTWHSETTSELGNKKNDFACLRFSSLPSPSCDRCAPAALHRAAAALPPRAPHSLAWLVLFPLRCRTSRQCHVCGVWDDRNWQQRCRSVCSSGIGNRRMACAPGSARRSAARACGRCRGPRPGFSLGPFSDGCAFGLALVEIRVVAGVRDPAAAVLWMSERAHGDATAHAHRLGGDQVPWRDGHAPVLVHGHVLHMP